MAAYRKRKNTSFQNSLRGIVGEKKIRVWDEGGGRGELIAKGGMRREKREMKREERGEKRQNEKREMRRRDRRDSWEEKRSKLM